MNTLESPTPTVPNRRTPATSIDGGRASVDEVLRNPRLLTALVLIGIALRVIALTANVPLWLDEILLSRNILALPLGSLLTQPLQLDQVAPRGFLLVEKLATIAFGEREWALRLFPFACGVASLFLFRRLAERALDGFGVPIAVALFSLGVPFIKYGSEVKQYAVDAAAAILLALVALDLARRDVSTRRLVLTGLLGLAVVWFSQAAVIVMAGIGLGFAVLWLGSRRQRTLRVLLVTMSLWGVGALAALVAGLRSMTPSTRAFMNEFWGPGFFPLPLDSFTDLRWFWDQGMSLFTDPTLLRYAWPAVFLLVAVVGIVALWFRSRDLASILLGPVVVALGAAIAHQYPFRGRLMFYLLPGLLLAIAAGIEWLRRAAGRAHTALGAVVATAFLVPPLLAIAQAPPPYDGESTRTMLAYLQAHRQPGDSIYVFPLPRIGTLFYGPAYGLTSGEWRTSICDRKDTRAYLRDVDRYRGVSRLWVFSSNARPYRVARPTVRAYLATIGVHRDSLVRPSVQIGSVSLDLYELRDTTRLRAATAETFPAPPMPTDPPPGCRPWVQPSPLDTLR